MARLQLRSLRISFRATLVLSVLMGQNDASRRYVDLKYTGLGTGGKAMMRAGIVSWVN